MAQPLPKETKKENGDQPGPLSEMTFNTKQLLRQSNHLFMGGISMISFIVNKQRVNLDVDPATPLLWVLRENLGLTGTK